MKVGRPRARRRRRAATACAIGNGSRNEHVSVSGPEERLGRPSAGIGIAIGGTVVLLRRARFCTAMGAYAREMTVSCIAARHTEAIVLPPTHIHVLPCVFKGERRRGDATEHYVLLDSAAKRRIEEPDERRPTSLSRIHDDDEADRWPDRAR